MRRPAGCEPKPAVVSSSLAGDSGKRGGERSPKNGRRRSSNAPTADPPLCCFCLLCIWDWRLLDSLRRLFFLGRVCVDKLREEDEDQKAEGVGYWIEEEGEEEDKVDFDLAGLAGIRLPEHTAMAVDSQKKSTHRTEFFTEYGEASRFEIIEVVGKGSYGVVAAAVDTHTGEKVAIKKINDVFEHVSDATRILREIKLLRLLRHPDIVEIKHNAASISEGI